MKIGQESIEEEKKAEIEDTSEWFCCRPEHHDTNKWNNEKQANMLYFEATEYREQ